MVKYETVIGIIGKTHGVNSERAPKVIASQINPQIGCSVISLSAGRTICGEIEFDSLVPTAVDAFDATFAFESRFASVFVKTFALTFTFAFASGVGETVGVADGVGLGDGFATGAPIETAEATEIVRGGMHTVSLQT